MEKKRITASIIMIIQIVILLVFSSYSWLENNWTPSVTEQKIQIATTGGMFIGLTGENGDPIYNSVEMNDIVGVDSFVFKQVSSQNGKDFFWVDFTPTFNSEPAVFRTANAAENGYIDADFCLIAEPGKPSKYVYLHCDTEIKTNQLETQIVNLPAAIRIAITFKGTASLGESDEVYIFGEYRESIDDKDDTVPEPPLDPSNPQQVLPEEAKYTMAVKPDSNGREFEDTDAVGRQSVNEFADYNGGRATRDDEENETPIDEDKILHTMAAGEIRWVNVKIWLEGGSKHCTDALAGQMFGLTLKFGSSNVPEEIQP